MNFLEIQVKLTKPHSQLDTVCDFYRASSEPDARAIRHYLRSHVLDLKGSRSLVTRKVSEGERVFSQKAMLASFSSHPLYTPEALAEYTQSSTSPYRKYISCRKMQAPLSVDKALAAVRLCGGEPKDAWPRVTVKQATLTGITRSLARFSEINALSIPQENVSLDPVEIGVVFLLDAFFDSEATIRSLQRDWSIVGKPLDHKELREIVWNANFALTENQTDLHKSIDLIDQDNIHSTLAQAASLAFPFFLCRETLPPERLADAGIECAGITDEWWTYRPVQDLYYWDQSPE